MIDVGEENLKESLIFGDFDIYEHYKFHAQLSMKKVL